MKILKLFKRLMQKTPIEEQKKPLKCVQEPTNPDDSVMLHTNTDKFYIDPRIER